MSSENATDEQKDVRPDFSAVRCTVFRTADYDTPLWSRANEADGRWHTCALGLAVQYWALAPETAWAELLRATGVKTHFDVAMMRTRIWAGQADASEIADLRDPAWQRWLNLAPEALTDDDWKPCQRAGQAVRNLGASGLLAPSAALPGRTNLVLFKRMVRGDWYENTDGQTRLEFADRVMPCQLAAHGGPDAELTTRTSYLW